MTKVGKNKMDTESADLPTMQNRAGRKVAFNMAPAMEAEVRRIIKITDLHSPPEVFRRALTLLRIHVDAAAKGREIFQVDSDRPGDRFIIALPFTVMSEPLQPLD